MKKVIALLVTFLISFYLFSNEIKKESLYYNNFSFIKKYSDKDIDIEKFEKIDNILKISHAVFAGITYTGFLTLNSIGGVLLYYAFTEPDSNYYKPLQYSHIGVFIPTIISYATFVTLGFIKLGIKIKNGFSIRKAHLVAAAVSLSFYFLEIVSIIISSIFFVNNYQYKEYIGLTHGIICGATTLSLTVSFITIFL